MSRMSLAEYIVRSLIRGLAYRVAFASPVWLAIAILAILFVFSLLSGV